MSRVSYFQGGYDRMSMEVFVTIVSKLVYFTYLLGTFSQPT